MLTVLLIGPACVQLRAQYTQMDYGRNRIQHKIFKHEFISTGKFQVYYYEGGRNLAEEAARYLETEIDRIASLIGYMPYGKTKIMLYNSYTDYLQSNVGLSEENSAAGGRVDFVKLRIEVPFKGNLVLFKQELIYELTKALITEMLFGGNLKEVYQSSFLLTVPEWVLAGAASYVAYGWDSEMDDVMRDLAASGKIKDPEKYRGKEAEIVGRSVYNYIARKQGERRIADVLTMTRIVRNEEYGIQSAMQMPYRAFVREWGDFYRTQADRLIEHYRVPERNLRLKKSNRKEAWFPSIAIDRSGQYAFFVENKDGRYKIRRANTVNFKYKTLYTGGKRIIKRKQDENMPLIATGPGEMLYLLENYRDGIRMLNLNSRTGKVLNTVMLPGVRSVHSLSVSGTGAYLLMSADTDGKSDIYLYGIAGRSLKRITNDIADDLYPVFMQGSDKILFASNRPSDTLYMKPGAVPSEESDLFIYNPATPGKLKRIAATRSNELRPLSVSENEIIYLSDQKGIYNLFKYHLETKETTQITHYQQDIKGFAMQYATGTLVYGMLSRGKAFVFGERNLDFAQNYNHTHVTGRAEARSYIEYGTIKDSEDQEEEPEEDPLPQKKQPTNQQEEFIDIDNYVFESERSKKKEVRLKNKATGLQSYAMKKDIYVSSPQKPKNMAYLNHVVSTVAFDNLMGMGTVMATSLSDFYGNHTLNAGLLGILDLSSSRMYAQYDFQKYRVDFLFRAEKHREYAVDLFTNAKSHKYWLDYIRAGISYPFSESSRISVVPFFAESKRYIADPSYLGPEPSTRYVGLTGHWVYDNTVTMGMNMVSGSRLLLEAETHRGSGQADKNFSRLGMDLRNYKNVHKGIVLATRFSAGAFLGPARKQFLLGGMDNWINGSYNIKSEDDPLFLFRFEDDRDRLFNRYVTNMRGFAFNEQNGNNYLLVNAELRVPVVKYLYKGVISSNFIRNLQFTGFYDWGSAWSGKNPFNQDNSLNTQMVKYEESPFTATVTNYLNPFLAGYGVGIRTMFLGYYVKVDHAWGVRDFVTGPGRWYFTLGNDF